MRPIALLPFLLLAACAHPRETPVVAQPHRTATVRIVVDDTASSLENVTRAAEEMGGYVTQSRVWREGETLRATVTIRVPSQELTSTMNAIRRTAKEVESETIDVEP